MLVLNSPAAAADLSRRLAERGPATLLVGTVFTLSATPALALGALQRKALHLPACRLGHGVKMVVAGAVVAPAGFLLSPMDYNRLPDAWLDGLGDAFQEDYCTRPFDAVLP